jgi:hypothetical protein
MNINISPATAPTDSELVQALLYGDAELKARFLEQIANTSSYAVSYEISAAIKTCAIKDKDVQVRLAALHVLVNKSKHESYDLVRQSAETDPDSNLRLACIKILQEASEGHRRSFQDRIDDLKFFCRASENDPSDFIRAAAISSLSYLNYEEYQEVENILSETLVNASADSDPEVRLAAIRMAGIQAKRLEPRFHIFGGGEGIAERARYSTNIAPTYDRWCEILYKSASYDLNSKVRAQAVGEISILDNSDSPSRAREQYGILRTATHDIDLSVALAAVRGLKTDTYARVDDPEEAIVRANLATLRKCAGTRSTHSLVRCEAINALAKSGFYPEAAENFRTIRTCVRDIKPVIDQPGNFVSAKIGGLMTEFKRIWGPKEDPSVIEAGVRAIQEAQHCLTRAVTVENLAALREFVVDKRQAPQVRIAAVRILSNSDIDVPKNLEVLRSLDSDATPNEIRAIAKAKLTGYDSVFTQALATLEDQDSKTAAPRPSEQ